MKCRWRFRAVGRDCKGNYLSINGQPLEHEGTDLEALAIADRLDRERAPDISHVEAVSIGCPQGITDTPGRLLVIVVARLDGQGWTLKGDWMSGNWYRSLQHAVSYAA